jgi:hypothetical protein
VPGALAIDDISEPARWSELLVVAWLRSENVVVDVSGAVATVPVAGGFDFKNDTTPSYKAKTARDDSVCVHCSHKQKINEDVKSFNEPCCVTTNSTSIDRRGSRSIQTLRIKTTIVNNLPKGSTNNETDRRCLRISESDFFEPNRLSFKPNALSRSTDCSSASSTAEADDDDDDDDDDDGS